MCADRLNRSFDDPRSSSINNSFVRRPHPVTLLPRINQASPNDTLNDFQERYYKDTTFITPGKKKNGSFIINSYTTNVKSRELNDTVREPPTKHHRSMSNPRFMDEPRVNPFPEESKQLQPHPPRQRERMGQEIYNKFKEMNGYGGRNIHLRGVEPVSQDKLQSAINDLSPGKHKSFEHRPLALMPSSPKKVQIALKPVLETWNQPPDLASLQLGSHTKLNPLPVQTQLSNEDEPFDLDHIENSYKQLLDTRNPKLFKLIFSKYYPQKK